MFSVLLVDDEPLVRTVIRDKIKWNELGFEFAGDCENGKQAVEFIEHRPVDLVITDINMPYMDGMELSRYLYTRYPDTAIVIFSGFSEFEYAQKAIQYKVVEYILKPVTASELTEVLVKVHKRLEESESNARKMNELTEVYQNYRKNQTAITSRLLGDLMLDSGDNSSTLNELKEAGIIFNYQAYCVACIRVDSWNDPNRIRTGESQDDSLYSFAIENICSEILKNEEKGLAFQSRDRYILLLLYTKKAADFRKEAVRLCHLCQDTISNVMHLGTSLGIGKSVRTVRDFGISYRNAMESMDYHYVLGEGYFLDMETDAGDLDQDVDLGDYLSKLTVAIKSCSHEKIALLFEEIAETLGRKKVSENRCRLYLQQIFRTIMEMRKLTAQPGEDLHPEEKKQLDEIAKSQSLNEGLTALRSYAYRSAETMRSLVSSNGQLQAILAIDYLNEHYAEPELNLNGLCSYLGISASHFSSLFKEYTGMTFMEKLTAIRIEKAKELLTDTTLRNYEIAERVGYLDPHYFSIVFKKATGQSPSDYSRETKA